MILVHLVSEQTLQNLLPTLALAPEAVLQVRSSDRRFDPIPSHFETACHCAGLKDTRFLPVETIPSDSPTIEDTEATLNAMIARHPGETFAVNLTGGTKLMSIGAYRFAEYHRLPSLYTDTQNRRAFVDGGTGQWADPLPELTAQAKRLTIPVVMAAQGKHFTEDAISPALLEFGLRAWELRGAHPSAVSAWCARVRDSRPCRANGRISDSRRDLETFVARPLPRCESPVAEEYVDAACEAGLVRADLAGNLFLAAAPRVSDVERTCNLLDGAWLELAVAAFAAKGNRFTDVHWSLTPDISAEPADYGETDLVLLDRERLQVVIVSCKSSLYHVGLLEHLSSWRDRARTLGGSHAAAHLCVFESDDDFKTEALRNMARNMGIKVHLGEEIPAFFSR